MDKVDKHKQNIFFIFHFLPISFDLSKSLNCQDKHAVNFWGVFDKTGFVYEKFSQAYMSNGVKLKLHSPRVSWAMERGFKGPFVVTLFLFKVDLQLWSLVEGQPFLDVGWQGVGVKDISSSFL